VVVDCHIVEAADAVRDFLIDCANVSSVAVNNHCLLHHIHPRVAAVVDDVNNAVVLVVVADNSHHSASNILDDFS